MLHHILHLFIRNECPSSQPENMKTLTIDVASSMP
jgi:hypothetical protein